MKLFLSVGHDALKKGAYNEKYRLHEYDILVELTQYCFEEAIEIGLECEKVFSDRLSSAIEEVNQKANTSDIAVELHINSFSNPDVKGCETLYYTGSKKGKELAGDIQNSMLAFLQVHDRGLLPRNNLAFLNKVKCTSIITEPFFLSNEDEVKRFLLHDRESNLRNIARVTAIGIRDFVNRNK